MVNGSYAELPVKDLKWGLSIIFPWKGVFVAFLMQCRHNADQIGPPPEKCGPIKFFSSLANKKMSSKTTFQSDAMLMDGLLNILLIDPWTMH